MVVARGEWFGDAGPHEFLRKVGGPKSMSGQTRFHAKAQGAQRSQGKDGLSSLPFFALSPELLWFFAFSHSLG